MIQNTDSARAKCHANSNFFSTFSDRDEHDVADAHDTGQQRSETDNPDEHVEPAEYSVHPFELVEVIVEIDGVLVGRGVVVLEREAAQHVIQTLYGYGFTRHAL